jgi:hypothetical protein
VSCLVVVVVSCLVVVVVSCPVVFVVSCPVVVVVPCPVVVVVPCPVVVVVPCPVVVVVSCPVLSCRGRPAYPARHGTKSTFSYNSRPNKRIYLSGWFCRIILSRLRCRVLVAGSIIFGGLQLKDVSTPLVQKQVLGTPVAHFAISVILTALHHKSKPRIAPNLNKSVPSTILFTVKSLLLTVNALFKTVYFLRYTTSWFARALYLFIFSTTDGCLFRSLELRTSCYAYLSFRAHTGMN